MTAVQEARLTELRALLSASGHRISDSRKAVLGALVGLSHPTAEEIHLEVIGQNRRLSLGTVYKTLDALKTIGQIQELEIGQGRRRYDGYGAEAHPHAICRNCGNVVDVHLTCLKSLQSLAENDSGFKLDSPKLEFYGICENCRRKGLDTGTTLTDNHSP